MANRKTIMNLTKIQEKAVNKIIDYYKLNEKIINFIAPTGSGKTFMIANVVSRIIENSYNQKIIFVIFTLSNAELPIQFKSKLDEYQDYLTTKFNSIYYESPSMKNIKNDNDYYIRYNDKDVLIFGTQTFGKGRIFTELERFKDFIIDAKNNGYKIIYIRDEAHIGDKKPSNKATTEQELIQQEADFIIKMTATPNSKENYKSVFIYEKDLNDEDNDRFLLKTKPHINIGFEKYEIDDYDILNSAIKQFKEVKKKYLNEAKNNNYIINPAMLIQISSKNQDNEEIKDDDIRIDEITKTLDKNNLSWVIYLSNRKESSIREGINKKVINLKEISKNNSSIDCIIFKVGPATGWDIPRACMLVQLRKVCSDKLNQQTIGRIKRNPNRYLAKNDLYMQYWIYSDHQEKTRPIHTYKIQDKFKETKIPSIIALDKSIYESKSKYIEFYDTVIEPFIASKKQEIIDIHKELFMSNKKEIIIKFEDYKTDDTKKLIYNEKLNNFLDIKCFIFKTYNENYWLKKIDLYKLFKELNLDKNMIFDQFLLIIFKDYLNQLDLKRKTFFSHKSKYDINYNVILPTDYIIYGNEKDIVDFNDIFEIYGYINLSYDIDNEKEITRQYLDSGPERMFLEYLIREIKRLQIKNKIELLAKNPLNSKVYFEYWKDSDSRYAKAYVDFIIKLKDKNEYLFIEIKSIKDYDPEKTESIKKAINQEYINIKNIKKDTKLSFCLISVNEKETSDIRRFDDQYKGCFLTINNDTNDQISSFIKFLENV